VTGGIRLQARRGQVAQTWWARRWLASLEAIGIGDRLERGRDYARSGQVMSVDVELGAVTAEVQGTRVTPYASRIEVTPLGQLEWLDLANVLAAQASYRAELLAGTMPEDIEAVFARAGLRLFPTLEDDLRFSCSCPDWATPCRHVAAVCYLVGEAFDRDPFLIFRLRGIERDVLLALLEARAPTTDDEHAIAPRAPGDTGDDGAPDATADGQVDAAAFWAGEPSTAAAPLDLEPPPADAPLVRVLGPMGFWRGADDFEPLMLRMYGRVAADARALDVALGSAAPATVPANSDAP
jgi:uncharacterized Zn finger protein